MHVGALGDNFLHKTRSSQEEALSGLAFAEFFALFCAGLANVSLCCRARGNVNAYVPSSLCAPGNNYFLARTGSLLGNQGISVLLIHPWEYPTKEPIKDVPPLLLLRTWVEISLCQCWTLNMFYLFNVVAYLGYNDVILQLHQWLDKDIWLENQVTTEQYIKKYIMYIAYNIGLYILQLNHNDVIRIFLYWSTRRLFNAKITIYIT